MSSGLPDAILRRRDVRARSSERIRALQCRLARIPDDDEPADRRRDFRCAPSHRLPRAHGVLGVGARRDPAGMLGAALGSSRRSRARASRALGRRPTRARRARRRRRTRRRRRPRRTSRSPRASPRAPPRARRPWSRGRVRRCGLHRGRDRGRDRRRGDARRRSRKREHGHAVAPPGAVVPRARRRRARRERVRARRARGGVRGDDLLAPAPRGLARGGRARVGDTLDALQALASDVRGRFDGPVVGITGSVGKTTTRALVAAALEASPGFARVHATSGNMNNHVGVPLTLLRMPPDTDACVLEMGMSGPGEIATLARVARPAVRVVLNVRPAHLEGAGGDLGDVARAKSEMFADAREGDACVVNADDAYVRAMRIPPGCRVASFGEDERAALEDERADVRVLFSTDAETPSTFALTATKRSTSGGGGGAGVVGRRRRASVVVSGPLRVALTEPGAHLAPCAAAAAAAARCRLAPTSVPRSPTRCDRTPPRGPHAPGPGGARTLPARHVHRRRVQRQPRERRKRARDASRRARRRAENRRDARGRCSSSGRRRASTTARSLARASTTGSTSWASPGRRSRPPSRMSGRSARMRRACSSRTTRTRSGARRGGGDEGGREGTRRRPRQGKPIHAHGPRRPQAHRGGGGGGGGRRGGAKEGRRGGGGVAW